MPPPTRDLNDLLDEDRQFCMTCGGEYTDELPCTCTPPAANQAEGDRYILHGVLARLTELLRAMDKLGKCANYDTQVRELVVTLTTYLKEDDDKN